MKYINEDFEIVDKTTLFSNSKFGHSGLVFTSNNGFTFNGFGIYEVQLVNGEIIPSTWSTILSTPANGFVNSFKSSNTDIWAVGNYDYPLHYNGSNWQPINIEIEGLQLFSRQLFGIWGNGSEIFICDIENSIIYHGK